MVGRQYVWVDDTHVHFWSAEGYDGWDESSWFQGFEEPSSGCRALVEQAAFLRTALSP
jgi:hypothetical protein